MHLVRQNAKRAVRRTRSRCFLAAVLTLSAVAAGCAEQDGPAPGGGRERAADGAHGARAVRPLDAYASRDAGHRAARLAATLRWRLTTAPLTPPPPPARKPRLTTREGFEVEGGHQGLPPVFTRVPTKEKVVFLTVDDGYEKDPAFLRMTAELGVPYSAFLSDYVIADDYAYFRRMRDTGVALHNHTLHHPDLRKLSYEEQRREICGMQEVMREEFGKRPELLRPPFGSYNRDTLVAAKSCGIKAVPLWNEEILLDRFEYRELDHKLHPGDIVLTHFRGPAEWDGTMQDMLRNFLKAVAKQGFAVARLEDYL